jgi:hypothetical protein
MLISKFPGKGRCYIWDPEAKRKVCFYTWENSIKAGSAGN